MTFQIREARETDAEEICRLNRDDLGYDYPPEKTGERLKLLLQSTKDKIFVAEAEGQIAGYVHACDYDTLYMPHLKDIMGIAVSGECRRQGVGHALLTAVERWAAETGAEGVRLVSGEARTGAHAFYRRCGYVFCKNQKNFRKMFQP